MTKIVVGKTFEKEAKRLIKKYRSLSAEIAELVENLRTIPHWERPSAKTVLKSGLPSKAKDKEKVAAQG